MATNRIKYVVAVGFVAMVGLAATSGAASAPATGSRLATDSGQVRSKIAFLRGNELFVVNADGSGQRRLTRNAALSTVGVPAAPAWSPDGQKIVYEGRRAGQHNGLYVVHFDGSDQRRLASRGHAPAWLPDGQKLAFFVYSRLYLMNADGSDQRTLVKFQTAARRTSLSWSPDGRKLAFLVGFGDCGDLCFNLHVVNADGSGLRDLAESPVSDPVWSPEGQQLVFVRLDARSGIYSVNTDGSGLRNLTRQKSSARYGFPALSPNGQGIAFVSDRYTDCDDCFNVWVMYAGGSGKHNLTRDPGHPSPRASHPAWSPDGREIAFVNHRDGNAEVYVMNADGSGQRNLTRSRLDERWLAWSPALNRR